MTTFASLLVVAMTLAEEGLAPCPVHWAVAEQVLQTTLRAWCCARLAARHASRCALFARDVPSAAVAALVPALVAFAALVALVALATGYARLAVAPIQRLCPILGHCLTTPQCDCDPAP